VTSHSVAERRDAVEKPVSAGSSRSSDGFARSPAARGSRRCVRFLHESKLAWLVMGMTLGYVCAAYRRAAARASSAWCGQLHRQAGGGTAGRLFGVRGILSVNAGCARVGGRLYVTLASREP
jgi:hypothetical protein